MKRLSGILFLSIFAFNTLGVVLIFKIQQVCIRHEIKGRIKAGIPQKDLYLLVFTPAEAEALEWEEDGREFRHHGRLFDIVQIEKKEGLLHYYCINDTQEEELFARLDELVNKQMENESASGRPGAAKIFKALKAQCYTCVALLQTTRLSTLLIGEFGTTTPATLSPYIELLSPPPRQA